MRDYNYRKHQRYTKGMRRLREDRAEHGAESTCPCLSSEAAKGKGKAFDRFAKHPRFCSCWMCRYKGPWENTHYVPDE